MNMMKYKKTVFLIFCLFVLLYMLWTKLAWNRLHLCAVYLLVSGIYIFLEGMSLRYHKKLMDLNYTKDSIISLINHELMTPLTSIKGFSEILAREDVGKINDMQKDFLTTILKSAKYLEVKINDIIELARFRKKEVDLKKENVDWKELIEHVYMEFKNKIEDKKIKYRANVDKNIGKISVDVEKIKKVLGNLLSNAIKFTGPGGAVEISAVKHGNFVETSVIDTGPGISKKMKKKIFEEFVQEQDSIIRKFDGLGLGLTLARNIIENHKGRIVVNRPPGNGTKITFILPIKDKARNEE